MSDVLSQQLQAIAQVRNREICLAHLLAGLCLDKVSLPTMEELMKAMASLSAPLTSATLTGLADGIRVGKKAIEPLSDLHNNLVASTIGDGIDVAHLFGIPIGTAVFQTLKWGALAYQGHIDAGTAVARIAISVVGVGVGSGVGGLAGTVLIPIPGLGTLIGAALGGLIGGRASRAVIQAEFSNARDQYLRAKTSWTFRISEARESRNRALQDSASAIDLDLRKQIKRGPNSKFHFINSMRFEAFVVSCRFLNLATKRFTRFAPIRKVRTKAGRILSKWNRRQSVALDERIQRVHEQRNKSNVILHVEFRRHLHEHAELIKMMIAELNELFDSVQLAMRKLGLPSKT